MIDKFSRIIKYVIGNGTGVKPLCGINISDQFHPEKPDGIDVEENLNAAFLISLAGNSHPLHLEATQHFRKMETLPKWKDMVRFYLQGLRDISSEISSSCNSDKLFCDRLSDLSAWISRPVNAAKRHDSAEMVRNVFFPEAKGLSRNVDHVVTRLRHRRTVAITELNRSPIVDPVKQIVLTSNVLVTTPLNNDSPFISDELRHVLKGIAEEEQLFWYDHPIPIGVSPESNEILYGLEGLDRAVAFEKEKGTLDRDAKLTCLLSVSVTHKGLQQIAKQYLEEELKKKRNINHLHVYVFTEADATKLLEEVLLPAVARETPGMNASPLLDVFGVNGEYGRHYTFLKAIAAFWQVFINPEIKGTFKIDLDQIFPQESLVEQTGLSAFEHFKTPLWGAKGTDFDGKQIELGMIAGALVNQKDIEQSLFFPDVRFPSKDLQADELFFHSTLPQALSTEAEMMTRYTDQRPDGKSHCIQRIHVTGGTNGILVNALRKHRPFTPSIIGRAEDQAYILSVLLNNTPEKLRYVHKDGLIMRHDKETFAEEAIKKAAQGKLIGDYLRILLFSFYSRALPWSVDEIKKEVDPFTGCFISRLPLTIVYLRFALRAASFFAEKIDDEKKQGKEFIESGTRRLGETISYLNQDPNPMIGLYQKEKAGWDLFYDTLDTIEDGLARGDSFCSELKRKASSIVESCKVRI